MTILPPPVAVPRPSSSSGQCCPVEAPAPRPAPVASAIDIAGPTTDQSDGLRVAAGRPGVGVGLIRAVGEIDLLTVPGWRAALDRALLDLVEPEHPGAPEAGRREAESRAGAAPRLVCDLSGVHFLAAAGLRVLVDLGWRAADAGVELRLVVASRPVRRVLEMTGLGQAWPVYDQLLDAVTGAGAGDDEFGVAAREACS